MTTDETQAPCPLRLVAFTVTGGPRAASDARSRLLSDDALSLEPSIRGDLLLLLTELVTNAVRHGGAGDGRNIVVTVAQAPELARVTVTDPGPRFAWQGRCSSLDDGGYGLVLVDALAGDWGVRGSRPTTVWFELPIH